MSSFPEGGLTLFSCLYLGGLSFHASEEGRPLGAQPHLPANKDNRKRPWANMPVDGKIVSFRNAYIS